MAGSDATCQHLSCPCPLTQNPAPWRTSPEVPGQGHKAVVGSTGQSPNPRAFSQQKTLPVTRGSRPPAFQVERKGERGAWAHPHHPPRGDPCTWSPPTPGRLENEAARALEEESPGRTPAVSDTISTQSLSKVVKLGLQLEWPVNPELNTFNGGSRHLGNIHRPINTSLDITLRETLHSPGKQ